MDLDRVCDLGFYGPDSLTWQLSRERAMLLGGPRALLLQLAHPLVAAGVAEHSSFRSDPLLRLRRTLDGTLAIVFGARPEAEAAAARINAVHRAVSGRLPEAAGRFPAGTPYDATDPELLLWVHATLVDTTLEVYARFVAPLTPAELERFYEESKIAGQLLGVPPEIVPPDLSSFRAYFADMITSDRIAVAPFQRELALDVLYPRLSSKADGTVLRSLRVARFVPRWLFRPGAVITIALLPDEIRRAYGFELPPARRRLFEWSSHAVRGMLPLLPPRARYLLHARRAFKRLGGRP